MWIAAALLLRISPRVDDPLQGGRTVGADAFHRRGHPDGAKGMLEAGCGLYTYANDELTVSSLYTLANDEPTANALPLAAVSVPRRVGDQTALC